MTKRDKDKLTAFLRHVYREAQTFADALDQKRSHTNDAANGLDRMASAAKDAHWHLTGEHISTAEQRIAREVK